MKSKTARSYSKESGQVDTKRVAAFDANKITNTIVNDSREKEMHLLVHVLLDGCGEVAGVVTSQREALIWKRAGGLFVDVVVDEDL